MATLKVVEGQMEAGKAKWPEPGFMLLPSVERLFKHFDLCRENGWLGVVTAPSGFGKTTAIRYYAEQHKHHVHHVTAVSVTEQPNSQKNAGGFLRLLLSNWERDVSHCLPVWQAYQRVAINLKSSKYSRQLLIIDEANLLHRTSLQAVRDIYDDSNAGIVLIGTPGLDDKLQALRNGDGEIYAPLVNRIGLWTRLGLEKEDVLAISEPYGLDAACRRFILAAAEKNGALRAVEALLRTAIRLTGDGPIGLQHLEHAAEITGAGS